MFFIRFNININVILKTLHSHINDKNKNEENIINGHVILNKYFSNIFPKLIVM